MDTTKLTAMVMVIAACLAAGCGEATEAMPETSQADALTGTWAQSAAGLCQTLSFDGSGGFALQWFGTDGHGTCQPAAAGHNEGTYSVSGTALMLSVFDPGRTAKPRPVLWTLPRSYAVSGDTLTLIDPGLAHPAGQDGAYASGAFARVP